jgi:serine/threonine protein kinase
LVTLFDAGQQRGVFFYAMEYVPGGSLESPAQALDRPRAIRAVADAASAASDLHDAGLVHRAIRPGNVLLTDDGGRLSDLGLAQVLDRSATVTAMGPVESLAYIDPRVMQGARATPSTDIWSLGAVLHFACTGEGVWGSLPMDDPLLALRRVVAGNPVVSETDADIAAVVRRCLDPDDAQRPASAAEFAAELRSISSPPGK